MDNSTQATIPATLHDYLIAPPTCTESLANQLPIETAQFDELDVYVRELCSKIQPSLN